MRREIETALGKNVGKRWKALGRRGQVHCRMRVSVLSVATVWVDVRTCVRTRVSECSCASERPVLCVHVSMSMVCVCMLTV